MSNKKIFLTALSVAFATSMSYAHAQAANSSAATAGAKDPAKVEKIVDEAILFKVQEISPVKNSDGKVTSCDYTLVFFNRSNNNLSGATIDLIWEDKSLNELSKESSTEKQANRTYGGSYGRNDENQIQASIEVPDTRALQQSVIRSRIQSDRCFVLMEEMTVKPRSCNMELLSESGGRSTKSCGKMFRYVAPNSLDYYKEFTAETPAEIAKKTLSKKEKIQQEINTEYTKTISEFNKASKELAEIK